MKKTLLYFILLTLFTSSSLAKDNNASVVDENKTLFSINQTSYTENSFPKDFQNLNLKEKKTFISKFIYYHIFFNAIQKELKTYHTQIEENLKKEQKVLQQRGIELSNLQILLLKKRVAIDTIGYQEALKKHPKLKEEIKEFYQKHNEGYNLPKRVEVSHIVLKDKNETQNIIKQLKENNESLNLFAQLAKERSLDQKSKYNGGYVGNIGESSVGKDFFNTLWETKEGHLVNKPVKVNGFYHIIYVFKKLKSKHSTMEEEKKNIIGYLLKKDIQKWKDEKYYGIKKLTKVKFYKIKL